MNDRTLCSVSGQTLRPFRSCMTNGLSRSAASPNALSDMSCRAQNASMSLRRCSIGSDIRLDIPNPSSWIYRAFAKRLDQSITDAMVVDIETVRCALREIMDRKGVKATTLSLMVGKNKSLVKDLFERQADVSIGTLSRLAGALDIPVTALLDAPRVPVVGYIGAGGSIVFEDLGSDETVIRPPNVSNKLVALVVRGSSMLPKYQDG